MPTVTCVPARTAIDGGVDHVDVLSLLREGELALEGRLVVASNTTLLAHASRDDRTVRCVYKPISGERPLWDFPDGTLAAREVAAYEISDAVGWHVVPPTVMRADGPLGPGMCQLWIEQSDAAMPWVDLAAPASVPPAWLPVLEAVDETGSPVVLAHADSPELRRLALLDVVVNNADRKGGHVLTADPGSALTESVVLGVDHGVCFNIEPKLRTVLWGWSGSEIAETEWSDLRRLRACLDGDLGHTMRHLLSEAEVAATSARVDALLDDGHFPWPSGRMPVPWPAF